MISATRVLALIAALTLGLAAPMAAAADRIKLAIGAPGSDSFVFGTELWAVGQIELLPDHGIDLEALEVAADDGRLSLLGRHDVEAALVRGDVPTSDAGDMRAIMTLWPNGAMSEGVDPVRFLVRRELTEEVVYHLTKTVFDGAERLQSAHASLGVAPPGEAMAELGVPLHPGAARYYRESGAVPIDDAPSSSRIYADFDHEDLDDDEVSQVVAACRQALEAGSLTRVLGDVAHTGCEVYTDRLADASTEPTAPPRERGKALSPQAISTASHAKPERLGEIFGSPVGKGGPAIRWDPNAAVDAPPPNGGTAAPRPDGLARQPVM